MQLPLIKGNGVEIYLIDAPVKECIHSRFNTRKTRNQEKIDELAERITQNGYERTRAVWAVQVDRRYEVFAGGTRLEATKAAGLTTIPIMLHIGLTDEEISRRADVDNENDEYHEPVPVTEQWAEYARLYEKEKWTQEQIAQVKRRNQARISECIKWHNKLPVAIKVLIQQKLLTEEHLRKITPLFSAEYFSSWLITSQIWLELAKQSINIPSRAAGEKAKKWKAFIDHADSSYQKFDEQITLYDLSGDDPEPYTYHPRQEFVAALSESEARSLAAVKAAKRKIVLEISNNLNDYKKWVDAKTAAEARKAIRARKEQELLRNVYLGDFRDVMQNLPDESVDLIFTDPPYDEGHIQDYGDLAQIAARVLKPNGSLIVYAGHYALPQIFELMCPHLTYWWQLIVKHSGEKARLPGKWVFVEYKPLLWFVKGGRRDDRYVSDLIYSNPPEKDWHEWQQDLSEAKYCIEQLTDEGDLIVDPFCCSGTTGIAALELNRNFWMCDIKKESIETTQERLLKWLDDQ